MWNTSSNVMPVVIGASGTVRKNYVRDLEWIPGQPSPLQCHKIALLGTAGILRKVKVLS